MKKGAIFLDRDGVINVDSGYVHSAEYFKFEEGAINALKMLSDLGAYIFIVTNQSGIGRGYFTEDDFRAVTTHMLNILSHNNINIDYVSYCPHDPNKIACLCRKPMTGMVDKIKSRYDLDLSRSMMFGDKESDVEMAIKSGIRKSVLINKEFESGTTKADFTAESLSLFVQHKKEYLIRFFN